jgi:hypothetical protein
VSKLWQLLFYTIVKLTIGMLCTIINDLGIVAYPTISIGCMKTIDVLCFTIIYDNIDKTITSNFNN